MLGTRTVTISDGCEEIAATRNRDNTYRVTAKVRVRTEDGQEIEATLNIGRANLHIEALESGGEFYQLVVPAEEPVSVDFPEPSEDDWKMLGFNEAQARRLADETCS